VVAASQERSRALRTKLRRLQAQKRRLKKREQEIFDEGREDAEELERLEAEEALGLEVANLEDGLMPGSLALDWSAFMPSELDFDDVGTASAVGGSS
jgi:hypothetical protein